MADPIKPATAVQTAAALTPIPPASKPPAVSDGATKVIRLPVTVETDDGTVAAGKDLKLPVADADRLLAQFGGQEVESGEVEARVDPASTDGSHVVKRNEKLSKGASVS